MAYQPLLVIPGQGGPGRNGNEGVLRIPQSSSITGTSPSDCLVSYPEHSLVGGGVLPHCSGAVGVFYSPSQLGNVLIVYMLWESLFLCLFKVDVRR